jgi:hypothetical protein
MDPAAFCCVAARLFGRRRRRRRRRRVRPVHSLTLPLARRSRLAASVAGALAAPTRPGPSLGASRPGALCRTSAPTGRPKEAGRLASDAHPDRAGSESVVRLSSRRPRRRLVQDSGRLGHWGMLTGNFTQEYVTVWVRGAPRQQPWRRPTVPAACSLLPVARETLLRHTNCHHRRADRSTSADLCRFWPHCGVQDLAISSVPVRRYQFQGYRIVTLRATVPATT